MFQSRKCIAIKFLLLLALMWAGAPAWAAVAGTVVNLSGPLMVKRADGTARILAVKSEVEEGDTLVTEKNTYAMLKLIDNSEITLRPGTTFTIDKFTFESGKPEDDNAAFNLVRGGLRSVTGLLGKRSKQRFALKTPTATIGIRGTTFVAQYVPTPQESPAPNTSGLAPGLYVQVLDGQIVVNNTGGAQNFSAGQFGYTPNPTTPPVVLPANPGLQFTPPPSFTSTSTSSTSASAGKPGGVDCIVR